MAKPKVSFVKDNGCLNEYGKAVARVMLGEGKTTDEVAELLGCKPTSARAVLAHLNR